VSTAVSTPLVQVSDLRISFETRDGQVEAVKGVSFEMGRERLGIVGESGSGKSLTARSLLGVLPGEAKVTSTAMSFDGIPIDPQEKSALAGLRGRRIGMVLQDPKFSLNPLMTVSRQITEMYAIHRLGDRRQAREKAVSVLHSVGLTDHERVLGCYPHELSGGMGQRVMIAMMLMTDPDLIVADEPTSALDVTVKLRVLRTLDAMVRQRQMGLILISHDLNLVAEFCDRILVMYKGRIVDALAAAELAQTRHPYTRALLDSLPRLNHRVDRLRIFDREGHWNVQGDADA
jgi:peptide/nickel transport system ATP-binding protein